MIAASAIGVYDLLRAERADACGIAEIAGIPRVLHSMDDARIPVVSVRYRGLPFYIQALFGPRLRGRRVTAWRGIPSAGGA